MIPRKKLGNETPMSVTLLESRSMNELRLTADRMPTTSARVIEIRSAATPSSKVAGSRWTIASSTFSFVWKERPSSPWTARDSQATYWTGSG